MTDPTTTSEPAEPRYSPEAADQEQAPPPFAPIYTLVNDASSRTMHHPQVHYIFSDDDPDILTHALAQQSYTDLRGSNSTPAPDNRAIILDLSHNEDGGYDVSWATSLSPSWAVLDAQLSRISPPSSDSETGNNSSGERKKKPDRLMLRIEGVESATAGNEGELRLSGEGSRHASGSGSAASGSSYQKDKDKGEPEDYGNLVEEFEKRMGTLKKVVDASEDRRRKVGIMPTNEASPLVHPPESSHDSPAGDWHSMAHG